MQLEDIRNQIDEIDENILQLFLRRMDLSREVARCKHENNLPIVNKTREREILARVCEKSHGMELYVHRLYSMIFELSRAYQSTLLGCGSSLGTRIKEAVMPCDAVFPAGGRIACQGVEGAYSQLACDRLFPRGNIVYMRTFDGVFDAVGSGLCDFGILPIENSSNGSVKAVYDLMRSKRFSIAKSVKLCIRHELLVKKGVKLSEIREIHSHEQAIGQCSGFIRSLPDNIKIVPCTNTAVAAKSAAESDGSIAAIASHDSAELYGLVSINSDIQNSDNNYTRFICITKDPVIYPGANKISLMLTCPHRPGALYDLMSKFNARGINLTKLESNSISGRDFEFLFFFDIEASVCSPEVIPMLEEFERECDSFIFLGNYSEI